MASQLLANIIQWDDVTGVGLITQLWNFRVLRFRLWLSSSQPADHSVSPALPLKRSCTMLPPQASTQGEGPAPEPGCLGGPPVPLLNPSVPWFPQWRLYYPPHRTEVKTKRAHTHIMSLPQCLALQFHSRHVIASSMTQYGGLTKVAANTAGDTWASHCTRSFSALPLLSY